MICLACWLHLLGYAKRWNKELHLGMQKVNEIIWQQFGASIDMLRNAIAECPDALWDNGSLFWYNAYHTLFFLDYYMSEEPTKFHPHAPFTMSEMNPAGEMPDRTYAKQELLDYLDHCRNKCKRRVLAFTDASVFSPVTTYNKVYPAIEVVMFNTRHVQHHTAQLNLLMRQFGVDPPGWVPRAKED